MKKRYLFIPLILILILTASSLLLFFNKDRKINKILNSAAYSYLPKESKNFIKKAYEETGEIILTEKNKQENIPYLNPAYIKYMSLSQQAKANVEEIPPTYALDRISVETDSTSYPSSYDLRNVGGKNYVTPIKNQQDLDLCWAFTSVEQVEGLLLKQSNTSYSSSSTVLSPRQMDYATSTDGIRSYTNEFGMRELGDGGNFIVSSTAMANGISLAKETVFPFTTSTATRELKDVMNYDNTEYELLSSEIIVETGTAGTSTYDNYISAVKNNVMQYGGVYVSAQAPGYSCASNGGDGKQIVRVDEHCQTDSNHAMHIIGWDDSYSYSYCWTSYSGLDEDGNPATLYRHTSGTCDNAHKVTGTGAWLLRNSWGNTYQYLYLAYDSTDLSFYTTTEVKSKNERDWERVYSTTLNLEELLVGPELYEEFTRDVTTPEKIEKVKFHTYGQNGTFEISVYTSSRTYLKVASQTASQLGYVTVDLSTYNVYVTDPVIGIHIKSTNGVRMLDKSISVFTSNYDDIPSVNYDNKYIATSEGSGYKAEVYVTTSNIPATSTITMQLYDQYGNNVSTHMTYEYNVVAHNDINMIIHLNSTTSSGIYTLKSYYSGNEFETKIIVNTTYGLEGLGTEESPYLIHNEDELRRVSIDMNAYYKLMNDITLANKWVPIGIETNPFTGVFDGNDHVINNLQITDTYNYAGLFGVVKANTSTTIKNLTIRNATVIGDQDSGILIGKAKGVEGYGWVNPESTLTLTGIYIIDGSCYSDYSASGSIIGAIKNTSNLYHGVHNYTLFNIFTSATVGGQSATGIIGSIQGASSSSYRSAISMTNIENLGNIDLRPIKAKYIIPAMNTHASLVGKAEQYSSILAKFYIVSPLFRGTTYTEYGLIGMKDIYTIASTTQGYNTIDPNVNITSLKNETLYSSWTNFYQNWKVETIDSIKRIPIIKNAEIDYTSIPSIEINVGQTKNISTIVSNAHFQRVKTDTSNEHISINQIIDETSNQNYDLQIEAISPSELFLHLVSDYDGYENNIVVTVLSPLTNFYFTNNIVQLDIGETYTVTPVYVPENTTDTKTITWESEDSSVATVIDGVITAENYGTTTVTGTLSNGMSYSITVKIIELVPITSFIISNKNVSVNPDGSRKVAVQINPTETTDDKTVEWTSSNENVAIVYEDGTIIGKSPGHATITGTLSNGMTVTTTVEVTEEEIIYTRGDLDYNGTVDLQDAIVAIRKIFKYSPTDDVDLEVGDVNGTSELDLSDVIKMIRYIFKYINEL